MLRYEQLQTEIMQGGGGGGFDLPGLGSDPSSLTENYRKLPYSPKRDEEARPPTESEREKNSCDITSPRQRTH